MASAAQKSESGSKTGIGSKKDRVGSPLVRYFDLAARKHEKRPPGGEPERP
jgi:hypothetical protein